MDNQEVSNSADEMAQRLVHATAQNSDIDAIHSMLLEVVDACGAVRNAMLRGETDLTEAFTHAASSLGAAFTRYSSWVK